MGKRYLLHYAIAHPEFRFPELQSISELFDFNVGLPEEEEERDPNRHFLIVELEDEAHARTIAKRCILIRAVYELWATATTYGELHQEMRLNQDLWKPFSTETFCFDVTASNHKIPDARQKEIIEDFAYMAYTGDIRIKGATNVLTYLEEYPRKNIVRSKSEGDRNFQRAYFGRLIEKGGCRELVYKFDVKQRAYYGNTTMEAEMSLLMANQALAAPGKLIYDPFVGTGSMLYTAAHFGAMVLGSDIDGRQMRGKRLTTPGIIQSASQYGVAHRILDCCTFDITRNPFRTGGILDAIVSDPPYGVRAGAKRLGRAKERPTQVPPEGTEYTISYPRMPYELSELTIDLILLARHLLRPGGRLVWFLPTVTEEYQDVDIPDCEGMELVANSEQNFGKWGRRLITMRKASSDDFPYPSFNAATRHAELGGKGTPSVTSGHKDFREKYFARFPSTKKIVKEGKPLG